MTLVVMSSRSSIVDLFTQYLHGFTQHRHFETRTNTPGDTRRNAVGDAHLRPATLHVESADRADQTGDTIMGSS